MWGGRFERSLDERALRYTTSLPVDRRLFAWDVLGSIAHARMLGRQGIIPAADSQTLVDGLTHILSDPPPLDGPFEDIHSLIEGELAHRTGEAAGKLHTARSRNDQVATDTRLFARAALLEGVVGILELQESLLRVAKDHSRTIIPGYTHLQRAQPVVLAHHLLAYCEMLDRDVGRLRDCYARTDVLPLGAAALAGSPYPLDREYVARLLGFGAIAPNSLDAVSDRDFIVEHLSALSLVAMHLSRCAEELVLWSTAEFGYVALDESFTTGSSIMPQKRNPDVAELLRGKTGRVYAALVGLLVTLKGLPLSYNRDLQEDKGQYFEAVDLVQDGLVLTAAMFDGAVWRTERMLQAANDALIAATDLADHLAQRGVPFRQAHEVVGRMVRAAESSGRSLADFSLEELHAFSPVFEVSAVGLSAAQVVAARNVYGGTSPQQVEVQLGVARDRLEAERQWLEQYTAKLPTLESVTAAG